MADLKDFTSEALQRELESRQTEGPVLQILLDASGSMQPNAAATVSAYNEMFDEQLRLNPEATLRLTTFNSERYHLRVAGHLTPGEYQPSGNTPLYDSIVRCVTELERMRKPGKTLVVIITDGQENSSTQHTREDARKLIERKQGEGWAFLYIGANQDAWAAGGGLGIYSGSTMSYVSTPAGTRTMAGSVSTATADYFAGRTDSKTVSGGKKNASEEKK